MAINNGKLVCFWPCLVAKMMVPFRSGVVCTIGVAEGTRKKIDTFFFEPQTGEEYMLKPGKSTGNKNPVLLFCFISDKNPNPLRDLFLIPTW